MGLSNILVLKNAENALKLGKPIQVLAISKVGSSMPKQGEELVAMGYQIISVTQTAGYLYLAFRPSE